MPQFTWIGKDKVENHDKDLPFRVLKPNKSLSVGESDNLLIEGDNLEALKALMPFYYNKVKCIYIDPPYNTGNEKWAYNDKVNSPQIKKWLHKVVGDDDLERHDKWLCMMYPRLKLLKELLNDSGVILVSINDSEEGNLRLLLNEIFGETNFLATFIWNNEGNIDNSSKIKTNHEYIYAYCKNILKYEAPQIIDPNIDENSKLFNDEIQNTITKNGPKNPPSKITLPVGFPAEIDDGIIKRNPEIFPILSHDVKVKDYKITDSVEVESGWSSKNLLLQYINNSFEPIIDSQGKETIFKITKSGAIYTYKKRSPFQHHVLTVLRNFGTTQQSSRILNSMNLKFDYPKPVGLIKYLITVFTPGKTGIVLDSFAGSGTTGQAVLEQNKDDGGSRKFILIELEQNIAQDIAAKRLKIIAEGYQGGLFDKGTGQGFQYLNLNGELFDSGGFINPNTIYEDLASYIYFTETHDYLDLTSINNPYLGSMGQNHYFLLFSSKGKNVLDDKSVKPMLTQDGTKVIYADKCLLDEEFCLKNNIIFKQIPYELKKF